VLLDAGTTTGALAHELRERRALTVVTTGMSVLQELAGCTTVVTSCLGGTLRPISQGFVGAMAEAALERTTFDRVFLGADAVTADDGICEADPQQTRLKELMTRRADAVYVLVHAAKLGRRPFHHWAPLPRHWTLVTDESAHPSALQPFRERGATVVLAPSGGDHNGPM
jgi:DeoR/GlpR family transcriptional regulator of sugar metabolism